MYRCFRTLCLTMLLAALPLGALADEIFSLKVGYLSLEPKGSFASRESGFDTRIDFDDDINFGKSEEVMAEAALLLGSFRLSLGYLPLNFTGTSTLNQTLIFNGQPFSATDTVNGELDVDLWDLGLTWYLLNFDDLPVRLQLGPELSVKVLDGDITLQNRTTGLRESVSGTVPVPTIGARARLGLGDFVAVIGRVGYVEYSDNSFLDADAQIEFSPIPLLGLFGGYRYLDIEVDEDDLFIDARFSGPYAGAFLRF
ncbi:MAG: hypothetical protein IH614_08085 [Desulfuromonadales bacterium]|nr:hypothetical protein [Desulfuromonadales bacterium]